MYLYEPYKLFCEKSSNDKQAKPEDKVTCYVFGTINIAVMFAREVLIRAFEKPLNDAHVALSAVTLETISIALFPSSSVSVLAIAGYNAFYDIKTLHLHNLNGAKDATPVVDVRFMKGGMLDCTAIFEDCKKSTACGVETIPAKLITVIAGWAALPQVVVAKVIQAADEAAGMVIDTAWNAATGSEVFKGLSLSDEIGLLAVQGSPEAGAQDL